MWGIFAGSLVFEWGPRRDEPTIIANQIDMIRESLDNLEIPMLASRQIVADDMKNRFDNEVDLNGRKWKKLSPVTRRRKRELGKGDKTILRRYDHLYNAVTDPHSYKVTGNDMLIDTASWPDYWSALHSGESIGRNSILPARPFAGVSEEAQFAIIGVFDEYIDGTLDIFGMTSATGVAMHRGAFGRSAGRIGMGMKFRPRRGILPR